MNTIKFGLAATLIWVGGCAQRTDHEVVEAIAGCYQLQWGRQSNAEPRLFPDSIRLTLRRYETEVVADLDADLYVAEPMHKNAAVENHTWRSIYRNQMWWDWWGRDSIRVGLGHDAAEFVGFAGRVEKGQLRGVGVWQTDHGPNETEIPLTGRRISCGLAEVEPT